MPSSKGVTEFVVGTGGHGIQTFVASDSRVAAGFDSTTSPVPFGALRLKLFTTQATFDFINTAGTVLDSGTISCMNAGSVGNPSPTPTLTSTATAMRTLTLSPTQTPSPISNVVPTIAEIPSFKLYLPEVFKLPKPKTDPA